MLENMQFWTFWNNMHVCNMPGALAKVAYLLIQSGRHYFLFLVNNSVTIKILIYLWLNNFLEQATLNILVYGTSLLHL